MVKTSLPVRWGDVKNRFRSFFEQVAAKEEHICFANENGVQDDFAPAGATWGAAPSPCDLFEKRSIKNFRDFWGFEILPRFQIFLSNRPLSVDKIRAILYNILIL